MTSSCIDSRTSRQTSIRTPKNSDHPDVVTWPPTISLICLAAASMAHFILPVRITIPFSLPVGILMAIASAALAAWAEQVMTIAGTNVRPDQPALTIVRNGPYRFTRNPMYLALCFLQLGWGLILGG